MLASDEEDSRPDLEVGRAQTCRATVHGSMMVDGQEVALLDVLSDPALCALVSDEGPGPFPRY
jgi:hypothetical protein